MWPLPTRPCSRLLQPGSPGARLAGSLLSACAGTEALGHSAGTAKAPGLYSGAARNRFRQNGAFESCCPEYLRRIYGFFFLICFSPLLWLANIPCLAAQLKVSPLALMLSLYLNVSLWCILVLLWGFSIPLSCSVPWREHSYETTCSWAWQPSKQDTLKFICGCVRIHACVFFPNVLELALEAATCGTPQCESWMYNFQRQGINGSHKTK